MQWGISFKIPAVFESDLWGLPPPSTIERLSSTNGREVIRVLYHFQYAPQSWNEWQRVASIKVQIKHRIEAIIFDEYEPKGINGDIYTVSSLGSHFKAFVRFPKPQYPTGKREAYKMLCRHAKRLYYEGELHLEQLIATSLRFNSIESNSEGISQTIKRAKASYQFALDHCAEWPVKLSADERHKVLSKSALKAAEVKRTNSQGKRKDAIALKKQGKPLNEIAEVLDIGRTTLWRWLK